MVSQGRRQEAGGLHAPQRYRSEKKLLPNQAVHCQASVRQRPQCLSQWNVFMVKEGCSPPFSGGFQCMPMTAMQPTGSSQCQGPSHQGLAAGMSPALKPHQSEHDWNNHTKIHRKDFESPLLCNYPADFKGCLILSSLLIKITGDSKDVYLQTLPTSLYMFSGSCRMEETQYKKNCLQQH